MKRRSDYRERLAARRLVLAQAYCKALGYKTKGDDATIAQVAKDAGLAASTVKTYMSGAQDMGPNAIGKLEAKLAAKGARIQDHLSGPTSGLKEFGNPKRKVPKLPQADREDLSAERSKALKAYCKAVGLTSTDETAMIKRLADDAGIKPVSIGMVLSGCSYLSQNRLRTLRDKLPHGSRLDLSVLGNDPRVESDAEVVGPVENTPPPAAAAAAASGGSDGKSPIAAPRPQAPALMQLSGPSVVILNEEGSYKVVPGATFPCVIVIDPTGNAVIHRPPAGAEFRKTSVMEADDGTGVITTPFIVSSAEKK